MANHLFIYSEKFLICSFLAAFNQTRLSKWGEKSELNLIISYLAGALPKWSSTPPCGQNFANLEGQSDDICLSCLSASEPGCRGQGRQLASTACDSPIMICIPPLTARSTLTVCCPLHNSSCSSSLLSVIMALSIPQKGFFALFRVSSTLAPN